jgi:hypothetical protein
MKRPVFTLNSNRNIFSHLQRLHIIKLFQSGLFVALLPIRSILVFAALGIAALKQTVR